MRRRMAFAFLLALVVIAVGCSRPDTTALPAKVDEQLAWIPQSVDGLVYFDMQSMRQSELGKQLEKDWGDKIARIREDNDYREFLEKTGFDVEKDLQYVLIGFRGDRDDEMSGVSLVATGNFDEQKIISAIDSTRKKHTGGDQHEFFTESYSGKTIYVIAEHDTNAFYFADAHTAVFAKKTWLQAIIDGKTSGLSVKQQDAVMALMKKLPYKDQCWMIANTAKMTQAVAEELGEHEHFKGTRAIKSLQGVIFSAHVREKAKLYGEALCDNEENSKLLADAAKGALAAAKLTVSDDREAVDMLNRIDIEVKGKSVKMSADLDKAFFDKMREKAEKHGKPIARR